ncbi:DUF2490 domain-containing protein [Paenimyroides tangerinum]|uniref:DUF2490 domain-containing protein n=1 Tax=Paenimyroides tangerinum TaxID=2488728 RepID=A0A3P3WBW6_9FLAO|nr:DUF2490 domain-containing protein [Paenimyroides tangerinum]RRJ92655.1 DUF2490 domain-containing protein [Paenimyroides tangerinum]
MKKILVAITLLYQASSFASNGNGLWLMYFGNVSVKETPLKVHYEIQDRNHNIGTDLNQILVRGALQYNFKNEITFGAGYGFIQTEKEFTPDLPVRENRIYQEALMQQNVSKLNFKHRFRYEQRFIENTDFKTRFRYQLGLDIPVYNTDCGKNFYATAYNEIFINGEKTETSGLFDRNRLFIGAGVKLNKKLAFQAGWMNQMLENSSNQQFMISLHHQLKWK